ncbi:MAG TPA: hypothetical protein VGC76_14010 [Pyrinomonadaceae bacterium]|jgi:hypothetical protein
MKSKFFALFVACAIVLNTVGAAFADTKSSKTQNGLLALLPASDAVVAVDAKRFFNVALPQILSGNKEMLDEINGKIDDFKAKTSIDIRQFEQIAVGVAAKQVSETVTDFEPIVLARGNFRPSSLVTLAKYASSGTYREEKIGNRIVYIFSAKEIVEKNKPSTKSSLIQKVLDKILPHLDGETAVTAYDDNTLAFGKLDRLRLLLTDSKSRVDANLLSLANRHPNAVLSFAANLPKGFSSIIDMDDDELGQSLDAIRQINGMMDVAGENTIVSFTAKTLETKQAETLLKNVTDLREVGKILLGSSKGEDKKVYARMLENIKIARSGSEVTFDLQIPQTDINVLIGAK